MLAHVLAAACGDDVPTSGSGDGASDTTHGGTASGPSGSDAISGGGVGSEGDTTASGASDPSASATGADTSAGDDARASSDSETAGTGGSSSEGSSTSDDAEGGSLHDSSSTSDGGGRTSDAGESSDDGGMAPICVDVELGSALGLTLGNTSGLADDLDPPCVPGLGGRDAGHRFVAPADGFYTFDTASSAFDTVLHAYAPECGGTLLGCNDDDALGVPTARLPLYLGGGQEAVVVVDGWDATQHGGYALEVSSVLEPCVDEDLGQVVSATLMGTTTGELDKLEPSCLPASGPDYVVRWVAPSNDVYRIRTTGSSFDTVLYVLPGECAGVPIACNDDASPLEPTSAVQVAPGFGQAVTIVIDGFDADAHGAFVLVVEPA